MWWGMGRDPLGIAPYFGPLAPASLRGDDDSKKKDSDDDKDDTAKNGAQKDDAATLSNNGKRSLLSGDDESCFDTGTVEITLLADDPPTPAFTFSCGALTCAFVDTSAGPRP